METIISHLPKMLVISLMMIGNSLLAKPILLRPRYLDDDVKKAYKYRDDIGKDVIDMMKKQWGTLGIPHGDWIERTRGKSIDIHGNTLFPDIDYNSMFEIYPGKYIISNRNEQHGLINRSGQLLVPMDYDDIDWLVRGLIQGVKIDGTIDLYTTEGVCLCSIKKPKMLFYRYNNEENIIEIRYKYRELDEKYHYMLFFPDGLPACGLFVAKNAIVLQGTVMADDISFPLVDNPRNRWKCLDADNESLEMLGKEVLVKNSWLKKANQYYMAKDYSQAIDCLNFFMKFDWTIKGVFTTTSILPMLCHMLMNCYYQTKNYQVIITGNKNSSSLFSNIIKDFSLDAWGLSINDSTGKVQTNLPKDAYSTEAWSDVCKYIEACDFIYQSSIPAYQNQLDRREKAMQFWSDFWEGLSQTYIQSRTNYQRKADAMPTYHAVPGFTGAIDNSSINGVPAALLPPSEDENLSGSASDSNSSSAKKEDKPGRTCTYCKGTGQVEANRSVSTYGLDTSKKECPTCHKMIIGGISHTHVTCTHCMGRGVLK